MTIAIIMSFNTNGLMQGLVDKYTGLKGGKMETEELLIELEAIRESIQSHWRSMRHDREEEVFGRVRKELDSLILTVRQRDMNRFRHKVPERN